MQNKKIVLFGQPNSGKSTIFQVLSDVKTMPGGTTYNFESTDIDIFGETFTIVDLPGSYSLNPNQPTEEISVKYLLNEEYDLIINVIDASALSRGLELTVELTELGKPQIIALNMQDETESHGVKIALPLLEKELGIPVVPTTAIYGKGIKRLSEECFDLLYNPKPCNSFNYTFHIEKELKYLESIFVDTGNLNKRFYTIKALENPAILDKTYLSGKEELFEQAALTLYEEHKLDSSEMIAYERHHIAMKLSEEVVQYFSRKKRRLSEKFDDFLLHPIAGYFFLIIFFITYFFSIFIIGDLLSGLMVTPIEMLGDSFASLKDASPFLWYSVNGAYQGFSGVAGIVLPYFLPLVFLTSLFEETGYIARIAFIVDGIFHKIGLHGKSVVPFILGFGCSVPALYATRIIENKFDRMITGILIPFIPCSARIAVIFALSAAFTGPIGAIIVFAYVMFVIAAAGKVLSKTISKPIGLIMEMPDLKLPSIKTAVTRTWLKISEFVKEALIYLVLGSIVLGWIEYFDIYQYIDMFFSPVIKYTLGLPEQLGSTLVFGFLRKELIIVMANQALGVSAISQLPMTFEQIIVFIIFVTLYFPCYTTFVVSIKEFGWKTAILTAFFSILIATVSAFLFRNILFFI